MWRGWREGERQEREESARSVDATVVARLDRREGERQLSVGADLVVVELGREQHRRGKLNLILGRRRRSVAIPRRRRRIGPVGPDGVVSSVRRLRPGRKVRRRPGGSVRRAEGEVGKRLRDRVVFAGDADLVVARVGVRVVRRRVGRRRRLRRIAGGGRGRVDRDFPAARVGELAGGAVSGRGADGRAATGFTRGGSDGGRRGLEEDVGVLVAVAPVRAESRVGLLGWCTEDLGRALPTNRGSRARVPGGGAGGVGEGVGGRGLVGPGLSEGGAGRRLDGRRASSAARCRRRGDRGLPRRRCRGARRLAVLLESCRRTKSVSMRRRKRRGKDALSDCQGEGGGE